MKAELITTNKGIKKKAAQIVRLYNHFAGTNEKSPMNAPELAVIAHVPGVSGGVWMEKLGGEVNIIYYAAFDKTHWRRGCLRACLKAIREKYVIHGVQVNPFDDFSIWQGIGFPRQDMVNMVPTLTWLSEVDFKNLCLSANS